LEEMIIYFKDIDEISFDIETEGFNVYGNRIISYQLGDDKNQFVVDSQDYPVQLIKNLLENKLLIIHNASFDMSFLYHYRVIPTRVWDTFLAESVIHKGDDKVFKALDATAYRYCKVTLDKTVRGLIHSEGLSARVIKYGADDVKYLYTIKRKQIEKLKEKDLMKSMALENQFVHAITYLKYCGIKLDKKKWIIKCQQDEVIFKEKKDILDKWIINNNLTGYIYSQLGLFNEFNDRRVIINWNSSHQVIKLFNDLGINTITPEGKNSVEEKFIRMQAKDFKIIQLYLDYKKQAKLLTTYGYNVLTSINNVSKRIHSSFRQVLKTGRISSGNKKTDKFSINLQNIPALPDKKERREGKIYERECFRPEDGNIFIDCDYSGQENIVFANTTMEANLLEFYNQGYADMHSYIASKIYPDLTNMPLEDIKKNHADKRQIAKSVGFALAYGGNGYTIANNINISQEEGDIIYNAYFKAFPGIDAYFKRVAKEAIDKGYILFNDITRSKRFLPEQKEFKQLSGKINKPGFWYIYAEEKKKNSRLYKEQLHPIVRKKAKLESEIKRLALNSPIQGTSAEITKIASIYLYQYLKDNDLLFKVLLVNLIHDEILIECPEIIAESMANTLKRCMEDAGKFFCKVVPLKAEPMISSLWVH
jgi:DNA polymerase-1